jgi:flavodoxin
LLRFEATSGRRRGNELNRFAATKPVGNRRSVQQLFLMLGGTMKILVVYYSRTGYTARVASALAAQCKAQTEVLKPVDPPTGWRGYLRSTIAAITKATPPIRPPQHSPELFDLVIIGTPVWAQNVSSPVRSYLASHAGRLNRVAFFCTMGGTGDSRAIRELTRLCDRAPRAAIAMTDAEIDRGLHHAKIDQFVRTLRDAESGADDSASVLVRERV